MKKRYVVTFLKRVADYQRHVKDVPQHQVDVFAASKEKRLKRRRRTFGGDMNCRIGLSMPIAIRSTSLSFPPNAFSLILTANRGFGIVISGCRYRPEDRGSLRESG